MLPSLIRMISPHCLEIGCVVNSAGRQIRPAFLRWQSPAKQVHYEKPYLYVYTLKAVEIWQVEDTQLVQLIPVPAMTVLNRHLKLLGVGVAVSTNSPLNMKATNETAWLGIVREKADK
ncbi:hypothetical protein BKA69DRAFT_383275 [Paraphysoderma sedebokerense]|nr:hypothetical protein BKA69DRAFT_383275 [Paraphysoderma sedebokerense]